MKTVMQLQKRFAVEHNCVGSSKLHRQYAVVCYDGYDDDFDRLPRALRVAELNDAYAHPAHGNKRAHVADLPQSTVKASWHDKLSKELSISLIHRY